jgi:leukotriene-A4 hydrolase
VLHGDNPDNSFTIVPFEKGFQFLQWIEDFVFGYYNMEDFITYYINDNSLKSISEFDMRSTMSDFVESKYPSTEQVNNVLFAIEYTDWLYEVGPDPTGLLDFTNPKATAAQDLALAYIALAGVSSPSNYLDYKSFVSN